MRFALPRDPWPRLRSERVTRGTLLAIYVIVLLAGAAEILRSLGRQHAVIFEGYVQVGDLVLAGRDPYSLVLNTWPPFFFFIGTVLALVTKVSATFALLVWQVGDALAIWGCCKLSAQLFWDDAGDLTFWPRSSTRLAFGSGAVLVPFLMTARLFQEHMQHTQINAQVLFLVLLAFHLFRSRREVWGGLSLAVAASTKAVPILLLPYLIYRRAWKAAGWTAVFLVALNVVLPGLVFGPERALAQWHTWRAVAARETADPTPHFMNQSFQAALKRITTFVGSARDPIHYAVTDWSERTVRTVFFGLALLAALWLAWRFRAHPPDWRDHRTAGELAILLAAMVIIDPLAWKAHYVVLIVPYTFAWWALSRMPREAAGRSWRWALWWGSFACITLSAPAVVGRHLRDVLESLNVILIGALLLLALCLSLLGAAAPDPRGRGNPGPVLSG
jgi:hypothetical protein